MIDISEEGKFNPYLKPKIDELHVNIEELFIHVMLMYILSVVAKD